MKACTPLHDHAAEAAFTPLHDHAAEAFAGVGTGMESARKTMWKDGNCLCGQDILGGTMESSECHTS